MVSSNPDMFYVTILTLVFLAASATTAHAQSFADVSQDHPAYTAIEKLKEIGILQGYDDGTFKPEKTVNRAEAVKIIVAPLLSEKQLLEATTTVYEDVPAGVWYLPYIEWARQALGIIDGPPEKTLFHSESPVILVEFLKMLELANGIKPEESFKEITTALCRLHSRLNALTDTSSNFFASDFEFKS